MKVTYENSIEHKALQFIEQASTKVFFRNDFTGLGSYRQISRVIKKLINKKKLAKIGFGIYVKAHQSKYIDEPLIDDGFDIASRKVLDRLNIQWEPGSAEQAYNTGETQQIPMHNIVRLKTRFRRKLTYANREIIFEGNTNAR